MSASTSSPPRWASSSWPRPRRASAGSPTSRRGQPGGELARAYLPGRRVLRVPIDEVRRELDEYFEGRRRSFDLALDLRVTPFNEAVLGELARVPYGRLDTYGALAARVGRPRAARAVGGVMNRNPIPIVLPCHRIVGANGSLTGYGGGLEVKRALLELEGATLPGLSERHRSPRAYREKSQPPRRPQPNVTARRRAAFQLPRAARIGGIRQHVHRAGDSRGERGDHRARAARGSDRRSPRPPQGRRCRGPPSPLPRPCL